MLNRITTSCTKGISAISDTGSIVPSVVSQAFNNVHVDQNIPKSQIDVVVGISGGVDSAVSAYLLKKEGYNVKALFLKSWDEVEETGYCTGEADMKDARKIAETLDIEMHHKDLVKEYWNHVFEPCIESYESGKTPNPDFWCNKEIKFTRLLDHATNQLGARYFATGHYARIGYNADTSQCVLLTSPSENDQTYFLASMHHSALAKSLFPVGQIPKIEVRDIARQAGLLVAEKKTSTGLCFVGKRPWRTFIGNYIKNNPGLIKDYETSQIIGKHDGIHFYTIGQRLGEATAPKKYYVAKRDTEENILWALQEGSEDNLLCDKSVEVHKFNWISGTPPSFLSTTSSTPMRVRTSSRSPFSLCEVILRDEHGSSLQITFEEPMRALASGQIAVLYDIDQNVCFGGGEMINR